MRDHIDRRLLLKSVGAIAVSNFLPVQALAFPNKDIAFVSVFKSPSGGYGVATITQDGEILNKYNLPSRGHDIALNFHRHEGAIFARRPGLFIVIIDLKNQRAPEIILPAKGRHFYGHGVFSKDGQLLFATENDFDNARGVIGIYDASNGYNRIGELDSYGVGPHDMKLLQDGFTLVVANGGIETHPDFLRAKLNIATMAPNLSFIDLKSSILKAQFKLPSSLHKLSIRHLTILDDKVWFACQNEGDIASLNSLVGHVSFTNGDMKMLSFSDNVIASLRGYVGSIAAHSKQNQIAFTSPRGGVFYSLNASTEIIENTLFMNEICGVTPAKIGFMTTTGDGVIGHKRTTVLWDNHIVTML